MATAIFTPSFSPTYPSFEEANWSGDYDSYTLTGAATTAEALFAASDGKTVDVVQGPDFVFNFPLGGTTYTFESVTDLTGATINSVQLRITMVTDADFTGGTSSILEGDLLVVIPLTESGGVYSSSVMTDEPNYSVPWVLTDLTWDGMSSAGIWRFTLADASLIGGTLSASIDYVELVVDYTGGGPVDEWWKLPTATEPFLKPGTTINGEEIDWPIFDGTIDGETVTYNAPDQFITICGVQYPLASRIETPDCGTFDLSFIPQVDFSDTFNWYYFGLQPTAAWSQTDPDPQGWWWSIEGFQGGANVTVDGRPKNPRAFAKIAAFATGNAGAFGGSPSCGVIFNNHLIYAGNDYTLGTTSPTIRTYDGRSDRMLVTVPNTTTGAVPKGILSMLAANGVIYVSTLDSGTSSADFAGRVFVLDPISAQLSVVGNAAFTTGHLPYALAWHMGRLWVGTNKGDGTAGKVYFFRPNIDTSWTQDYDLATSTTGGATSMYSYKGKLMVGTDNADALFAKLLARDTAGAYTTSLTATGGTAKVNNGFLAMTQFGENLYASYFNNDATAVSKIYKFDNTSWSTVYTGSSGTLRPYLGMFVESGELYAIGGGLELDASLIQTANGSSWTDLTAFLSQSTTHSTGLPIFGTVSI